MPYAPTPYKDLPNKLQEMGISMLYTGQAETMCKALEGRNVALAATTASRKTLCYDFLLDNALCRSLDELVLVRLVSLKHISSGVLEYRQGGLDRAHIITGEGMWVSRM